MHHCIPACEEIWGFFVKWSRLGGYIWVLTNERHQDPSATVLKSPASRRPGAKFRSGHSFFCIPAYRSVRKLGVFLSSGPDLEGIFGFGPPKDTKILLLRWRNDQQDGGRLRYRRSIICIIASRRARRFGVFLSSGPDLEGIFGF